MRALGGSVYDHLSELAASGKPPGIPTGFPSVDEVLGGIHPENLTIVAARPGMGKTAFALNVASNVVRGCGLNVLLFSMEMGDMEVAMRQMSSDSRINGRRLRSGSVALDEWDILVSSMRPWHESPADLFIDASSSLTPAEIRARATRVHRRHPLSLIVIDYLTLIRPDRVQQNNHLNISTITKSLKALAKDLHVPVMCLSQLSRNVEGRADKRPVLSDLRESGSIEEDADQVIFLYRPAYYMPDPPADVVGLAEVIVAKNRAGECKKVPMQFQAQFTQFLELAPGMPC